MFIFNLVVAIVALLTSHAKVDGDTTPAGATPAAGGATPPQSQPASTPAQTPATPPAPSTSTPSATGTQPAQQPSDATPDDEAQLGDAGKRALDRMKAERDTAERERKALAAQVEQLTNATKSDQDKAIDAARREGEQASDAKWVDTVRTLRIEGALRDAGCIDPSVTAAAREFSKLEVEQDGTVKGLAEAIEAFKEGHGGLFGSTTPTPRGDFGNGHRSGQPAPQPAATLEDAVAARYAQADRGS